MHQIKDPLPKALVAVGIRSIYKYRVLVSLQELVEEHDNLDKAELSRLTDYWDRSRTPSVTALVEAV